MNDRVSGFCGGLGTAALLLWGAYIAGGTQQVTLVTIIIMTWGLLASLLVGVAALDWWWDERRR